MSDFCPLCGEPREICEAYGRCYPPAATGSGEPHGYVGSSGLCGRCGHGITHWTHSKQAQMLSTPPMSQPTVTTLKELSEDYRWEAANIVRFFDHPGMTTEQKVEFLAKELAGVHLALLRAAEQK